MRIYRALAVSISFLIYSACLTEAISAPVTIQFEPGQLTSAGYVSAISSYSEAGFDFSPQNVAFGNPAPSSPINGTLTHNGTGYLFYNGPADSGRSINMSLTAGGAFDLTSFDAAEAFVPVASSSASTIAVTGFKLGGGIVTTAFALDLIADGLGGVADFQTFALPGTFTDLVSVTFLGEAIGAFDQAAGIAAFSIDNVVVEMSVPAPGTLAITAFALAGLGFMRRLKTANNPVL